MKHTLLSWELCFRDMGRGNGITTSSLFRRGSRGGKSDGGGSTEAAHVAAFVEPADSRPRGRGRRATPDAPRSRHRTDTGGPSLSRARPLGAIAGGRGKRSCSPGSSSRQAMFLDGLSDRTRIDVDARSLADLARRTAKYRRDDIEPILAAACGWPFERKNRCGGSSTGKRSARVGVPSAREGAFDGDLAQ